MASPYDEYEGEPAVETVAATEPEPAHLGAWPHWRYDGPQRVYAEVPVTVDAGDVVAWPEVPAGDGCWTATDEPANRKPDNHEPPRLIAGGSDA